MDKQRILEHIIDNLCIITKKIPRQHDKECNRTSVMSKWNLESKPSATEIFFNHRVHEMVGWRLILGCLAHKNRGKLKICVIARKKRKKNLFRERLMMKAGGASERGRGGKNCDKSLGTSAWGATIACLSRSCDIWRQISSRMSLSSKNHWLWIFSFSRSTRTFQPSRSWKYYPCAH